MHTNNLLKNKYYFQTGGGLLSFKIFIMSPCLNKLYQIKKDVKNIFQKNKYSFITFMGIFSFFTCFLIKFVYNSPYDLWGYSSVGRALQWHCKGQEFDPPYLHQFKIQPVSNGLFLCLKWGYDKPVIKALVMNWNVYLKMPIYHNSSAFF